MSLTIKHLNADASFLLTFSPNKSQPRYGGEYGLPISPTLSPTDDNNFSILIDPWLTGPSKIFHSKFSTSTLAAPSCVSSLSQLPTPNLVLISQNKSDHCHRETLTQLPSSNKKTTILAEPGAARTIRSWKHFDNTRIKILKKFDESGKSMRDNDTIYRIPIPALSPRGGDGEVTVAYIPQKYDLTNLHSAIMITYLPPTSHNPLHNLPATPPDSPHSISTTSSNSNSYIKSSNPITKPISILYSPHGISPSSLTPYLQAHPQTLPLTLLLHCFSRVFNPWYLGGTICSGLSTGAAIAQDLEAETWISAHDGEKVLKGVATGRIREERVEREMVEKVVSPKREGFVEGDEDGDGDVGPSVLVLGVGEEIELGRGRW